MKVFEQALAEVGGALQGVDPEGFETACRLVAEAGTVAVCAGGREGLQIKGFAMRLFHLGCNVGVAGEMTAPPLGKGDLLVASEGPGGIGSIDALMRRAGRDGAHVLMITAEPDCDSAKLADTVLVLPAQTMARDQGAGAGLLPMGSVYEGALFFLFEAMILDLRDRLGVTAEAMRARHTNLE